MRTFATAALTVAVLAFATSVCNAQGRGGRGGFMQPEGPMLLLNKSVQDELKVTDDQKKELTALQTKNQEAIGKAMKDVPKGDKEAMQKAIKEVTDDTTKSVNKIVDTLKDGQKKRFKQIQVQVKGIRAFQDEDVAKALKLTDKQKDEAKTAADDLDKDRRDMMQDAGRDATKRAEAQTKIAELTAKATDKITGAFTDDQKKTYKELVGEKFDYKPDMGTGRGGKGKGTDKSF